MSYRYTRQQYLNEQVARQQEKFGVKVRKENPHRVVAYLNRVAKRAAIASGLAEETGTWDWEVIAPNGVKFHGTVLANTRSEARAAIKRRLKIKHRLPVGAVIKRRDTLCLV